ncbi:hypothetical protein AAVH_37841, partial [Aphelenchoides avenae]
MFSEPQVPFPAVTFCNLNPFKKTMAPHSQELTNLLAAYTYVSKVKQARMKSGTTSVAKTTTAADTEIHALRKRGAAAEDLVDLPLDPTECQEAQYTDYDKHYTVWSYPNGTAYVEFT